MNEHSLLTQLHSDEKVEKQVAENNNIPAILAPGPLSLTGKSTSARRWVPIVAPIKESTSSGIILVLSRCSCNQLGHRNSCINECRTQHRPCQRVVHRCIVKSTHQQYKLYNGILPALGLLTPVAYPFHSLRLVQSFA